MVLRVRVFPVQLEWRKAFSQWAVSPAHRGASRWAPCPANSGWRLSLPACSVSHASSYVLSITLLGSSIAGRKRSSRTVGCLRAENTAEPLRRAGANHSDPRVKNQEPRSQSRIKRMTSEWPIARELSRCDFRDDRHADLLNRIV